MSVRAFYEVWQTRWQTLCRWLWPPTSENCLLTQMRRLADDLSSRYQALVKRRCRVERLRGKLTRQERRIAQLGQTIAALFQTNTTPEATWPLALRLDRLRHAAQRTRGLLRKQEHRYERQRSCFEKRKHTLREMQRGLLRARLLPSPGQPEL